ncbi:uncharacterized protein LOC133926098 [Phragmites australis]|uniref:uncharacterized protein LOC133926098 n=1 Tax=Phragmites australis TaxID=29695 RepID=UPI002D79649C|nr:uncharacterized protein LOC133926098 [Phragmites australis]
MSLPHPTPGLPFDLFPLPTDATPRSACARARVRLRLRLHPPPPSSGRASCRRNPTAPTPPSRHLLQWGCIAKSMMESAKAWAIKCGWGPFTAPSLEDLLPELSCEEQVRLQSRLRIRKRWKHPPLPSEYSEVDRDTTIIPYVRHALRHYNDKHPGGEFDAVKPLMEESVRFRGKVWYHVNFWARSRSSNKMKRFFAEVHYKKPSTSSSVCSDLQFPVPIPIVEVCTIIEEPLARYRRSCAFCRGNLDILHPLGSRKFVCGNDKDRMEQQLKPCLRLPWVGMPFTCPPGPASPNCPEELDL